MPILYLINAEQFFVAPFAQPDEVMIVRYVQPLAQEQRQLLETTMKDDPSFRARSRAHGLLLSAHGTTIKDIAKDLSGPSRHRIVLDQALGTAWRPEFA
jgi:hypothetical protein